MMNPMQNPMMFLLQAARGGKDPMTMLRQMAGQSPRVAQALQMVNGKTPAQLRQMAENMARERGINLDEMIKNMGIRR